MIEVKQLQTTDEAEYRFVETLMHTAFPREERRDDQLQRAYTDQKPCFHCNIIYAEGQQAGLVTYWDMKDFSYIEHFATDPALRGKGYGKRVLEYLQTVLPAPIVLEVEEPTDEMSRRRIGFYQRLGFTLHDYPYRQPPYRKGDAFLPMRLMTYGTVDMATRYEPIRDTLYREVYGVGTLCF